MLELSKVFVLIRVIDIFNLIVRIGFCSVATIIDILGIFKSTVYLLFNEFRR